MYTCRYTACLHSGQRTKLLKKLPVLSLIADATTTTGTIIPITPPSIPIPVGATITTLSFTTAMTTRITTMTLTAIPVT